MPHLDRRIDEEFKWETVVDGDLPQGGPGHPVILSKSVIRVITYGCILPSFSTLSVREYNGLTTRHLFGGVV